MDRFPETCLAVYMAEDANRVDFITVNVILRYLFWAYATLAPEKKDEYLACSCRCGVNVETALSSLPLHLPASDNVIVALALGVIPTSVTFTCLILTDLLGLLCH